jgi:hypothetical protein
MLFDIEWVRDRVAQVKDDGRGRPRVHAGRAGNARVHPNGFIQLDLIPTEEDWHGSHQKGHSGSTLRLHIWNPPDHPLPHQGTTNEIHTHVFDMNSNVIRGKMNQRIYSLVVGSEWYEHRHTPKRPHQRVKLYKAVYKKSGDSRLFDTEITGLLIEDFDYSVFEGQTYFQPAFTFHDSDPEGCTVTVMEKTVVHDGDAYVLVPTDIEPDNSYDRANAAPEDFLWSAIEAAIA